MPVIQAKVIAGVFDADQKRKMIERLTDAMVSIEGEAMRDKTYVLIEETHDGEWGIGGRAMTASAIKELAGRR